MSAASGGPEGPLCAKQGKQRAKVLKKKRSEKPRKVSGPREPSLQ